MGIIDKKEFSYLTHLIYSVLLPLLYKNIFKYKFN